MAEGRFIEVVMEEDVSVPCAISSTGGVQKTSGILLRPVER